MDNGAAITYQDSTKKFGRKAAVEGVTFAVPRKTVFGLLGPNGAGKTTLFSLTAGFLRPTRGRVQVLGIDVEQISELRGRLSILPQDAQFQPNVPILQQMIFFCRLSGFAAHEADTEARRALGMVGLGEEASKNARVLSHGMAKRLGIAQAFLGKPEVILLDEPTSGLDPVSAKGIRDLIKHLQTTATLVISSHNLREIQEMCTHVAIMDNGRLVECNTVAALTQTTRQVRMTFSRALAPHEIGGLQQTAGVMRMVADTQGEYTVHLDLESAQRTQDQVVAEMVAKLMVMGVVPRSISEGASLEARFLEVTGKTDPNRACPNCGYSLQGITSERCPECGQPLTYAAYGKLRT